MFYDKYFILTSFRTTVLMTFISCLHNLIYITMLFKHYYYIYLFVYISPSPSLNPWFFYFQIAVKDFFLFFSSIRVLFIKKKSTSYIYRWKSRLIVLVTIIDRGIQIGISPTMDWYIFHILDFLNMVMI